MTPEVVSMEYSEKNLGTLVVVFRASTLVYQRVNRKKMEQQLNQWVLRASAASAAPAVHSKRFLNLSSKYILVERDLRMLIAIGLASYLAYGRLSLSKCILYLI